MSAQESRAAAPDGGPAPPLEAAEVISRDALTREALPEERARAIVEEFEAESATRPLVGPWRLIVGALAVALSAYALYWTQYSITTQVYRASFLLGVLVLSFLLYPIRRGDWPGLAATIGSGLALLYLYYDALPAVGRARLATDVLGGWLAPAAAGALALAAYAWLTRRRGWVPAYDLALAALSVASLLYLMLNYEAALQRIVNPTPSEVVMGILAIVLALEATRRTTGWILPAVAIAFLIYAYLGPFVPEPFDHRGYPVQRLVGQNFLTLEGMFGVPLDVAATFIILFTIYGAVLEYSGAGKFFLDWSFAALGRSHSGAGPGRTVTAAGFLLGTVSGSGVATTVTLGSLAWPMLRRAGYDRDTAGGILSAAGIGALLSPPTLGAAAFLIAEYLRISYLDVLVMAIVPTLLYYLSCLLMIEADSRRMHTHAVQIETLPFWTLTARYGYHFSSLFAVAVLMAIGQSAFMAVFWSIAIAFALSFLRVETRLTSARLAAVGLLVALAMVASGQRWSEAALWGMLTAAALAALALALGRVAPRLTWRGDDEANSRVLRALEAGGRGALSVGATTAAAGVIVSVVTLTGLGLKISGLIVALAAGTPFLTILYAAVAIWVLGLAVPVTASYIIAAVMIVPALTSIGVPEPAAHMFVFYYAVLADVSPPTALSPFAAAAITGGNPFRTMMLTWRYCLPAFLVPFMFTLSPEGATLLLLGPGGVLTADPAVAVWTLATSCLAVAALAVALGGWLLGPATTLERALIGVGGLALLYASLSSDLVGGLALAVGAGLHVARRRRNRELAASA
jgi:TRAP transporter 4TM/12TM fusion protein